MFWSRVQFAARRREDSRPLYRRIFTNRRLDIAHKGVDYYSVLKKKQLQKELDAFERQLKDLDTIIVTGKPQTF
ncbi:Protein CBG25879 [Caenorhabditis briggsae]|uniref:Protein CBG25879 n=1 Tax=Caenorhabditis briggsae TaxID=6238 RepID=B6IHN4_CAEBR|nr:Protein CBG25879 [Caenorhabditis briggsae]CAR99390.1 Protein CBG25879 [Caenorhabditis briggsae]